jgi:hypothetical protein
MTDFYLDPESGSDAGAGTSFATRWKTLTSGATTARIAPGDRIKVIASRDAYSLGNATFTDNSPLITLATAKTMNIDTGDSTGWTVSTNVTKSTTTYQTEVATSVTVSNFNIASGFTTGKIAFKAFGSPLDLSAYTAVGCLVFTNTALTTNMKLRLCSDATGDVPVLEIPFRAIAATGTAYTPFFFENGSALPSGINSISLFAAADPGTVTTFRVINIFAGQARGHADHIAHECLIGKGGSEPYYPIAFIDGTKITTNLCFTPTAAAPYYYRGTTETTSTSVIDPLRPYSTSAECVLQDSGTTAAQITISGGWDRTDMSTQTGVTWWSGYNSQGTMLNLNSKSFITVEKIGYVGCQTNFVSLGAINVENKTHTLQFEGFVNGVDAFAHTSTTNLPSLDISVGFINTISGTAIPTALTSMASVIKTKLTVPLINNVGIGIDGGLGINTGQQEYNIGKITNAATAACRVQSGARLKIGGTTFAVALLHAPQLGLRDRYQTGMDHAGRGWWWYSLHSSGSRFVGPRLLRWRRGDDSFRLHQEERCHFGECRYWNQRW